LPLPLAGIFFTIYPQGYQQFPAKKKAPRSGQREALISAPFAHHPAAMPKGFEKEIRIGESYAA
jgi:hypothetical protein